MNSDPNQENSNQNSVEILPKELNIPEMEEAGRNLWESHKIYEYDPDGPGEIFSVDTPPPYVSAAHLHVGHAMSYSQAEFVIRYQRMQGRKIFYPMGFDDNGLPTERYVEKTYKINKNKTTRSEFRKICLEETSKGALEYEKLWRALGLSVDWRLKYSTIDTHCQRTSQKSFLDLYSKGLIERSSEPVLWDVELETSLAQADLETIQRKSKLHDIAFKDEAGGDLVISTTRPELLPACVALYCNPNDERYQKLLGGRARVPLSDRTVPIKGDDEVRSDFGTGLMMVCTFGDSEDVRRWKSDELDTILVIGPNGRLTAAAGKYEGLTAPEARKAILADLEEQEFYRGNKVVEQAVSVSERSEAPVEFNMAPQWFIKVRSLKDDLLKRSGELEWHPPFMKSRLDQWIDGLKYDWNISRQRFYGVPFPIWYCNACGEVIVAEESSLPVDPLESSPPVSECPKCQAKEFKGEADVMDTWMTSSLTPLISANWAGTEERTLGAMNLYPMTVRVQAYEIIRTWLFYTVVKSHLHTDSLPWQQVMISGWGLNEQGKKISKRDLEKHTNKDGFNHYEPYGVIGEFGADALRYWAAGSHLGNDLKYNAKDVKAGQKLVIKLWNAARYCTMNLSDFNPDGEIPLFASRSPVDRWVLTEANNMIPGANKAFENYNYARAREIFDHFFWSVFCDNYLEMIKDIFWKPERHSAEEKLSAQATLWEVLRHILSCFAPFLPFITEHIYQHLYQKREGNISLHLTAWPEHNPERTEDVPEMKVVETVLNATRALRSSFNISQTKQLPAVIIDLTDATPEEKSVITDLQHIIRAVVRCQELRLDSAETAVEKSGLKIDLVQE